MKLVYLAQTGLFDNWAHTVQIMKMCEAFSENKIDVTLVVPKRRDSKDNDPFVYNNTKKIFKIAQIPYIDLFHGSSNKIFYFIRYFSFLLSAKLYIWFTGYDLVYTREPYYALFFKKVCLELHSLPNKVFWLKKISYRKASNIVVLTSFIKNGLVKCGVDDNRIIVCHDAVRIEDFDNLPSKQFSREKLNLPQDKKIIGYIGTLKTMGMEKGVSTLINSLVLLPEDFILYVVGGLGGKEEDVDFYKKIAIEKKVDDRVIFTGKVPHSDIPTYISTCDVLASPFPDYEHYRYYMSPLKIFEYMASKKPIISTNLPSIKEVLIDQHNSILVSPDSPSELSNAIVKLTKDTSLSNKISENAYLDVSTKYTWNIRARNILEFINK